MENQKLLEAAAPRILADMLKGIMKALSPDPKELLESIMPVKVPVQLPTTPLEQFVDRFVNTLLSGVEPKRALEAIESVKKVLEEYGLITPTSEEKG